MPISPGLSPTRRFLLTKLPVYAQALLELLIDSHWVQVTLQLILEEPDDARRNELIDTWLRHRFADLDRINITGVLVAGVISSAFSWYNFQESPWPTRATWYCGLLFSMAAITTAGVHSAGLHRLGCHPEWHAKLRRTLGAPVKDDPSRWRPHALQPIMWQTPGFMLKLAITCFLVGLTILIWDAAKRSGVRWGSDDTKIAFMFTIAAGISLILYGMSVLGLFFKTVELSSEPDLR